MDTKNEKKEEISRLRSYLITRFLGILAVVSSVEILVSMIVSIIMTTVASGFTAERMTFSLRQDLLPMIGAIGLHLLGRTVPMAEVLTDAGIDWLENIMLKRLPEAMVRQILNLPWYIQILVFVAFLILVLLYLLPIAGGTACFIILIQRKMLELEQRQKEVYENFEKQRSLMLADIAHDLRNPITAVYGYAQALTDGMITGPEEQREYLEVIKAKSGRINDLIQLLFDYTKLDSPGFTLNREKTELCELLRENAALIYPDMEEAGMELEVEIPETELYLSMDSMQVSRVVTNLLTNVLRHNPAGTKVLLALTVSEREAVMDVADSGEKIDPELIGHLFEPFAMGDKSRGSNGGSGLGLAIAYKIAQMHGWTLSCEEMAGYTKTFRIRIPLR